MNENIKTLISYILAILIVGSLIACFVIAPYKSLLGISWILLGTIGLVFIVFIVRIIKDILYMFFDSKLFQSIYHDYITKQKRYKPNRKNHENIRHN